jgi:hypothetical protein bfra3_12678
MKKTILTIALCVAATLGAAAATKPGVEVLRDNDFKQLAGKRVGLITNPTGVDNNLKSTVDILHEAKGVELVALFGPEHGVRGNVHAGDEFGNTTDPATGVKVFSIYGKTKKPTKEMLSGIDALVYDIQDIGCRSFTFVSTLGLALDACAENNIEFVVLDRPNPLGGNRVEGCLVEDGFYSFVSQFKIPYLYGMTPGEMARYLNGERVARGEKAAKLTVVPLKGWKRSMTFDKTGMPWVLPSPHIPQPATAFYYPATGILGELYYVSIGVGYTLPFQLICADWIDADKFAERMNALNLPGTKFRPIHVKPFYGTGKGENLQGVQFYVDDVPGSSLTLIQFYAMQELAKLYPEKRIFDTATDKSRFDMFDKVCGTDKIRTLFSKNYQVSDMIDYWNKDADAFKEKAKKYYLYK